MSSVSLVTIAEDLSAGFCNIYKYSGNKSRDKSEKVRYKDVILADFQR